MLKAVTIQKIIAREVLDSRGFPTVEVEMTDGQHNVSAIVPSGASTGEGEALELRDGDKNRYLGKGVLKAVQNIQEKIAPAILGKSWLKQTLLDDFLRELDGTENKSKLGANAILAVSMAFARLQAQCSGLGLSTALATTFGSIGRTLPVPLMNVLNGGKHADNGLAIQEFMIVPLGFNTFSDGLRAGVEVFHHLKKILHERGLSTAVGDEGGFAPNLGTEGSHQGALILLLESIQRAGYKPGDQIGLALDCAASEFCKQDPSGFSIYNFEGQQKSSDDMIAQYENWCANFPIVSIEDGLSEHDWSGWKKLTAALGKKIQLIGDDLFVTNPKVLQKGIDERCANAILIKLNQIGTVTETLEAMKLAQHHSYNFIVSHRSGETEDTFIADLALGTDAGQIKTGSASRTDRLAKYNQLLRLEQALGPQARYAGKSAFRT